MEWLGALIVSPVWGLLSVYMFYRSWVGFLGVTACIIGFFCSDACLKIKLLCLYHQLTMMLFYGTLLLVGFWFFFNYLPFGRTTGEALTYWLSTTAALALVLPKIPVAVDRIWSEVNGRE